MVGTRDKTNAQIREEFIYWETLSKRQRRAHRLPESQSEFAEVKGVSSRCLRRWKSDPEFQERVRQLGQQEAQSAAGHAVSPRSYPVRNEAGKRKYDPPEPATEDDDPAILEARASGVSDRDEQDYHVVKASIRDKAADGDREALALYMKHWGHEYAQQEKARRESSLSDLSDRELVYETLELVGVDLVREWLAGRGGV